MFRAHNQCDSASSFVVIVREGLDHLERCAKINILCFTDMSQNVTKCTMLCTPGVRVPCSLDLPLYIKF